MNETTGALIANSSTPELVLNAIQQVNAGDLVQLGRQFLSAAYLMVNQDTNEFTLWEANPTSAVDLVAVDSNGVASNTFCAAEASTSTGTSAPGSTTTAPAIVPGPSKLSGGAIAGIAIGSIVVIAAIAGILYFCLFRRKNGSESKYPMTAPETSSYVAQDMKSELPGAEFQARHEVDGTQIHVPGEMPGHSSTGYIEPHGYMGAHELAS